MIHNIEVDTVPLKLSRGVAFIWFCDCGASHLRPRLTRVNAITDSVVHVHWMDDISINA